MRYYSFSTKEYDDLESLFFIPTFYRFHPKSKLEVHKVDSAAERYNERVGCPGPNVSRSFQEITRLRTEYTRMLLDEYPGEIIQMMDSDIVFLANTDDLILSQMNGADMAVSYGVFQTCGLNLGQLIIRSTPETRRFMERFQDRVSETGKWDEEVFNDMLRKGEASFCVRALPRTFAVTRTWLDQMGKPERLGSVTFHATEDQRLYTDESMSRPESKARALQAVLDYVESGGSKSGLGWVR